MVSQATRRHPLWSGSILDTLDKVKALRPANVHAQIDKMSRCDDLTPREASFLLSLKRDMEA